MSKLTCSIGAVLFTASLLFAETVTLQQGLNGYTGASDTHLESTWGNNFPGWKGDYSADVTLGVAHNNYNWLGGSSW